MNYTELTKTDKEMIKQIADGTITCLEDFEKIYFKDYIFTYDVDLINRNKQNDYLRQKSSIENYLEDRESQFEKEKPNVTLHDNSGQLIDEYSLEDFKKCELVLQFPYVSEADFTEKVSIGNKKYEIKTLEEPVYFKDKEDIKKLSRFCDILLYLNFNNYITFKNMKNEFYYPNIILNKVTDPKLTGGVSKPLDNNVRINTIIDTNTSNQKHSCYVYKNNDKYYSPEYLQADDTLKNICSNFYDKYIAINDTLHVFINNDFKPLQLVEQTRYKKSSTRAWVAIIISIIIGTGSIITSIFSINNSNNNYKQNTDFWEPNETAEITAMNDINKNLEEIQTQLETNSSESDTENYELTEKLEELINLLTEYADDSMVNP